MRASLVFLSQAVLKRTRASDELCLSVSLLFNAKLGADRFCLQVQTKLKILDVRWPKSVTAISVCSRQFQFVHGNFNLLTAISICSRQFPVWVRIGLHTFLFMRLHGTDLKMNSDRSDFISVADRTWVTFVPVWDRTVPYRSHIKQKTNLRPGP